MQRRAFLETTLFAALAADLIPTRREPTSAQARQEDPMTLNIQDGETVLFQGDSITDAGRDREKGDSLGAGYAMMIASWLSAAHPERKTTFLNRGISGNRVVDLKGRWRSDCLDLKPDWVSILIGVNDTWRRYDSNDPTSTEDYERGYRDLLDQVSKQLKAKLILLEPFLLHVSPEVKRMREDLDPKIEVVRKLAKEYQTRLIPTDVLFSEACAHRPADFWAADGVHPTPAGHALIAQAWIRAVSG